MSFVLRKNLHWCLCQGRVVFLDVEADRYFCLTYAAQESFQRLAAGDARAQERERLAGMAARGLLIQSPGSESLQAAAAIAPPTGDLLEEPYPKAPIRDVLKAAMAELRAAYGLRAKPLLEVIGAIDRQVRGEQPRPTDLDARVRRIVSASAAASLLLRATDRCLVRALALHAICRRQGILSSLVFGVRVNPFTAHCWVQLDETVLVGDFEQARLFTPIMVAG